MAVWVVCFYDLRAGSQLSSCSLLIGWDVLQADLQGPYQSTAFSGLSQSEVLEGILSSKGKSLDISFPPTCQVASLEAASSFHMTVSLAPGWTGDLAPGLQKQHTVQHILSIQAAVVVAFCQASLLYPIGFSAFLLSVMNTLH